MKIFITATNTDIGKTYATLKFIKILSKNGNKVGVFKPIETGVKNGNALDANLLFNEAKKYNDKLNDLTIDDICPVQYKLPAAPFVAKGNKEVDFKKIQTSLKKIEQCCDVVLIEGAGGVLVPVENDFYMSDFIQFLNIDKTILITPDQLGCINDTLLSIEHLKTKTNNFEWVINLKNKSQFNTITKPFYEKNFENVHFLDNVSYNLFK